MAKAKISTLIRKEIFERDTHCQCCGSWDANHIGHIIAEKNGGTLSSENLLRKCEVCNTTLGGYNFELDKRASYTECKQTILANRARWIRYCESLKKFVDAENRMSSGKSLRNPYKKPKPYIAE